MSALCSVGSVDVMKLCVFYETVSFVGNQPAASQQPASAFSLVVISERGMQAQPVLSVLWRLSEEKVTRQN